MSCLNWFPWESRGRAGRVKEVKVQGHYPKKVFSFRDRTTGEAVPYEWAVQGACRRQLAVVEEPRRLPAWPQLGFLGSVVHVA
jgi:hypothetical protein